ncbi:MAG: DNA polymerase III subunit delta' [Candidatus Omnitrophota bacterium]
MVLLKDVKGQNNVIRYLSNSLSSGRTYSSYLFTGPEGVGRTLVAKAFVMALMCDDKPNDTDSCGECPTCRRIEAGDHPDIIWIKPEKNKAIKIEQVRGAKDALSLKPYESKRIVCVIEDAHLMTRDAANALLKVLEEPPGHSVIILTTNKKELLLETVISRCSEVRFRSLSIADTKDIIMREDESLDEEFALFLAHFSQGSPGRALEMVEEGVLERKDSILGILDTVVKEENSVCLNWDIENKTGLLEDIDILIMVFRDIVLASEGAVDMIVDKDVLGTEAYSYFEKYPVDEIYSIVEKLVNMRRALMGNVNPKLVAQALPGMLK